MPNRLWLLRGEPREVVALPRLDDDLRDRASCGVPVLLLTRERLLDHLVGDVGRQPLEGGFGRFVFPEPEKGAHDLGDCEHGEQKRHDRREHARHGDSDRRDRAHDRALAAGGCRGLRRPGGSLAGCRVPGPRGSAMPECPCLSMLGCPLQSDPSPSRPQAPSLRRRAVRSRNARPVRHRSPARCRRAPRSRPPRTRRHRRSRA